MYKTFSTTTKLYCLKLPILFPSFSLRYYTTIIIFYTIIVQTWTIISIASYHISSLSSSSSSYYYYYYYYILSPFLQIGCQSQRRQSTLRGKMFTPMYTVTATHGGCIATFNRIRQISRRVDAETINPRYEDTMMGVLAKMGRSMLPLRLPFRPLQREMGLARVPRRFSIPYHC